MVALVLGSFVLLGVLSHAASVPRFFLDELYYMDIGVSLAHGDGFEFRGDPVSYGPLFPLLIAGIVRLTENQVVAYELIKLVNSAAFALAAVPVYLLARRLLPPWPSVGVVALSAAIPSSAYVAVVMTESLAYLLAACSLLAVVRASEHPSASRQLLALGVVGVAVMARPQFVAIYAGYLLGLAGLAIASPARRAHHRNSLLSLWPTAGSVVLALAWLARPLVRGDGLGDALGSYSVLVQSYDPLAVAKWFAFHVGDVALYVAVIPVVVAPAVLALLWRQSRAGSARDAAFLALFTSQNVAGVGLVAAFASSEFGLGLLYDRYLFYLVPLWLLVFVVWLHEGMPRPVVPLVVGAVSALALVAVLPYSTMAEESWFRQFQAVATEVWGKVAVVVDRIPLVSLRAVAVLTAVVLVAVAALLPRKLALIAVMCVGLGLTMNLALSWRSAFVPAATYGLASGGSRTWVDDRVGAERVWLLTGVSSCAGEQVYFASLETEVFNRSVDRRADVGSNVRLRDDGEVVDEDGPLRARYVVAEPDVALDGARLATGLDPKLVLWRVSGRVRVQHVPPPLGC